MNSMPADDTPRTQLTWEEVVIAATALFELNINESELSLMAEKASVPLSDSLRLQWMGFVHAGIICAIMDQAPRRAVVEYIAQTKPLLNKFARLDEAAANSFIDTVLNPYVQLIMGHEQRKTPFRLLEQVMGKGYPESMEKPKLAFISGMMAITLCNILDTLGRYEFLPDTAAEPQSAS